MANNRIFYPCESLAFAQESTLSFTPAHGVQSCGMNTNFNIRQIFELSQLAIYENKEDLPVISITAQKKLDGYPLLLHLATQGSTAATLVARAKPRCNVVLGVYSDSQNSASGVPIVEAYMSGLFVSNSSFTFDTQNDFTEDFSAQGNDKIWRDTLASGLVILYSGTFLNNDLPLSSTGSGGVNFRKDFIWECSAALTTRDVNGMANTGATAATQMTILPPDIDGITSSGVNTTTAGVRGSHVTRVTCGVDLSRTDLLELGQRGPYFRYVPFPVQVTSSITVNAVKWDNVSGTQAGVLGNGNNLNNRTIKIKTIEGTFIDLGTNNKLTGVTFDGGDTGGGVVNCTYNYITFNDYTVTHPQDSTTGLRAG